MIVRKALPVLVSFWRRFALPTVAFAVIALIVLLFPYRSTVVPEWRIRVIDEAGKPFAGAAVRQTWYHYSYQVGGGGDQTADELGYAVFPERTFTASLLYRVWRVSSSYLFAKDSVSIRSTVWAYSPGGVSDIMDYQPGMPLPQLITLRR